MDVERYWREQISGEIQDEVELRQRERIRDADNPTTAFIRGMQYAQQIAAGLNRRDPPHS
jgi:hypothetical protein